MNVEALDTRLIETDEVRELRDLITCAICCQIITEDRNPHECEECQNTLFCKECIDEWYKKKPSCPCCRKNRPKLMPANPVVMAIISGLQFACINKERGCQ